nr:hypothetical protein [Tanacetum cinerariifolium]
MSTQQDIYAARFENRPYMLNKDNYVLWSSRIIRYAMSRPNGKMIVNSIDNGPYVRRMIATPGEPDLPVPVPESFHEQTNEELTENDIKWMDVDDQVIQTILLGLPEDVYAAVDSCETAKEIWERVRQMMKGSDIGEHEKKIYDFLKMNHDEVNELRVERLVKSHDPLALMAHSQNSFNFSITHKEQSSSSTHSQQSFPINNKYNPQTSLNQNFMQPPMTSLEDINDPTEAINAALILFDKAFQLTAPTNNNQRTSSNPRNRQIAQPVMNMSQDRQIQNNGGIQGAQNAVQNACVQSVGNQNGLVVIPKIANQNGTGNVVVARAEGIQLQAKEFDFMAAVGDLYEIEGVNANCILMANLQHPSTSGTQLDKAPVYDTDGSVEVQLNDNCYDNEIFNMFTQEERYTNLLGPIHEPQLVPQNDNHVIFFASSMVQSRGTVETSSAPNEETRAHQETVYHNLVDQVDQVNMVNCNMRATNAELKSELARYKIQEQRVEISQENYDKLEMCYLKSVYQEQCLTRKINALHLSSAKQITTLNDEISNLNKQLSKEKSSKFVRDFKSLAKEADESLDKQKYLELEIERLLKASVSHDIMSIVQNGFVDVPSDLQTELDRTTVTPHVDKPKLSVVTPHSKKLHASTPSHSVPQPREFNVVKHRNVIAHGMFKINPSQTSRENGSSDTVTASSTGLMHTTKTRRQQPKGNTRNARVPFASKSSEVKKNVTVEDHRRTLLLSKNQKTMSSECNNIKLAIWNDKSKIVCGTCKQCLVTANHDACLLSSVNALNSRTNNTCANVSLSANQKRHRTQVWKPKQVGSKERLACCSKHMTGNIKLLINFVWKFLGTVRFGNDHIVAILGYGDLKWGNITITEVYFVEEVAFRRNICFISDLDGVDLLKGKSKRASHPPKPVLNSKQRLHLLHIDLCGPMRVVSINGKRVGITHETSAAKTPQQNGVVERKNRTLVETARTIVYNRRTKKIIETMNVTFDELSAMAFEQNSSRPGL